MSALIYLRVVRLLFFEFFQEEFLMMIRVFKTDLELKTLCLSKVESKRGRYDA